MKKKVSVTLTSPELGFFIEIDKEKGKEELNPLIVRIDFILSTRVGNSSI